MSWYALVLFVHIAAAIVLVGGGVLATPVVHARILRSETAGEARSWMALGRPLAVINPASSFTLLGSGLVLAQLGGWWEAAWLQVAIAAWVVNVLLAARVVRPAMGRFAAALGTDDSRITGRVDDLRRTPRWGMADDALVAIDIAVLYLMTMKPGYVGSVVALVVASAAVIGLRHGLANRTRSERAEPLPAEQVAGSTDATNV
jgi:hypothetical protein